VRYALLTHPCILKAVMVSYHHRSWVSLYAPLERVILIRRLSPQLHFFATLETER
jgi:hypothetical protein